MTNFAEPFAATVGIDLPDADGIKITVRSDPLYYPSLPGLDVTITVTRDRMTSTIRQGLEGGEAEALIDALTRALGPVS